MDKKIPHPHAVKVVFGKPLLPNDLEAMGTGSNLTCALLTASMK